jgi:hypothetical protein
MKRQKKGEGLLPAMKKNVSGSAVYILENPDFRMWPMASHIITTPRDRSMRRKGNTLNGIIYFEGQAMPLTKIHGKWIFENEPQIEEMDEVLQAQDQLAGKVLSLLHKVVSNYANLGDHAALDGLQACLSEVMRQASVAMQEGKKMKIAKNLPNDVN